MGSDGGSGSGDFDLVLDRLGADRLGGSRGFDPLLDLSLSLSNAKWPVGVVDVAVFTEHVARWRADHEIWVFGHCPWIDDGGQTIQGAWGVGGTFNAAWVCLLVSGVVVVSSGF